MADVTEDTQELVEELKLRLGDILVQLVNESYLLICVRNGIIESNTTEDALPSLHPSFKIHVLKKAEKNALEKILNDNILSTNIKTRDGMELEKDLVVKNLQERIRQLVQELSQDVPRNPVLGVM